VLNTTLKFTKLDIILLFGSILSQGSFWDARWVTEPVLSGSRSGFVDFKVVFSPKNGKMSDTFWNFEPLAIRGLR